MKINLGTIDIPKEKAERLKEWFSREEIIALIKEEGLWGALNECNNLEQIELQEEQDCL